ncbi:Checkpoint protein HUS1 [Trichinella pseudospiralis]|uniref:Checkpoint protein n=2 Tax=Trichinella pseudospiralis TaxID=6337 RepID=A0A0V1KAT9_TRIPS|nr:Checkpoint protein HUS1 [Trichinella pseudospiralis]KRY72130.1 Checkpoint protein HUS1 [Trichinella pseudospiralis]KRY93847.1 Checkpoint protein HUS1 [Trichinella pseudospiralis]KRZ07852.1 Checkpoint protein HUS1 [Trichinella pseudospiralis]KRZ44347.1 Checkpoint protein HUS1 [Trichinella pseudospiralis]
MKLSVKISNTGSIENFTRLISAISKLSKECIIRIVKDKLYITKKDFVQDAGQKFLCDLNLESFFTEFRMEGWSADNNEIYLQLSTELLLQALKTGTLAKSLKIRLTKKVIPYLTLEIKLPTITACNRLVTHDIPVTILLPRLWPEKLFENWSLDADLKLLLPPVRTVHKVVAGMKHINNYIMIAGSNGGELTLKVETDEVSVASCFPSFVQPSTHITGQGSSATSNIDLVPASRGDGSVTYSTRIDIRWLLAFLSSQLSSQGNISLSIMDGQMVYFTVNCDDYLLHYYIPAVSI